MDGPDEWAEAEFGHAALGDVRRTARLVALASACAQRPGGLVTAVVESPADREGAYRFLESEHVAPARVAEAMFAATALRFRGSSSVIVAVDQSSLAFTDRLNGKGLGRTGGVFSPKTKRGFQVMSALAVRRDGETLGLLAQSWRVRPAEKSPKGTRDARPDHERESALWSSAMTHASQVIKQRAPGTRAWFQLDRGADANHVLLCARGLDADVTIRSAYDRRLETGDYLHCVVRRAPSLGTINLSVPAGRTSRLRKTTLALRSRDVVLRLQDASGKRYGALAITVVHAVEVTRRRQRIQWYLLTTKPVSSLRDAAAVVSAYRHRWRIEEFHRAWKSGVCDVENSQLRSAPALQRWATILAAVASRAERLKTQSRSAPADSALTELSRDEVDAAILLSRSKTFARGDELTLEQAVELIAFVGGYTGRKNSGGPPGTVVITRGLHDVMVAARALALARSG